MRTSRFLSIIGCERRDMMLSISIVLGLRGVKDSELRKRLAREEIILLTQDTEFEDVVTDCRGQVIISRVRQNLPIQ